MSLRKLVVEMIVERGCGTVDHLMPRLEPMGYTRYQATKALQNASNMGFLWCEPASKRDLRPDDKRPGVYWPGSKKADPFALVLKPRKEEPRRPMVASVFELGSPRPESEWPMVRGTPHRPLGEWEPIGS